MKIPPHPDFFLGMQEVVSAPYETLVSSVILVTIYICMDTCIHSYITIHERWASEEGTDELKNEWSRRDLTQSSQGLVTTHRRCDSSTVQPMIREGCPFPQARLLRLIGYTAHNTSLLGSLLFARQLPCRFGQVLHGPVIEMAR